MHTRRMRAHCDPYETDESIVKLKIDKAPKEIQERCHTFYHATPDKPVRCGYRTGYCGLAVIPSIHSLDTVIPICAFTAKQDAVK